MILEIQSEKYLFLKNTSAFNQYIKLANKAIAFLYTNDTLRKNVERLHLL